MTEISIASAQAGPVLHFTFLTFLTLGIYKLSLLLTDFITRECKSLEFVATRLYSFIICIRFLHCFFKLYLTSFTKALKSICNNYIQCNRKIYTYNGQQNSKFREKYQ